MSAGTEFVIEWTTVETTTHRATVDVETMALMLGVDQQTVLDHVTGDQAA